MTSLADELEMDPAFDDAAFGDYRNGGGVPLSLEQDESYGASYDDEDEQYSPVRHSRKDGSSRRMRQMASDLSDDTASQAGQGAGAGFSLADELGGGEYERRQAVGSSLADEVNGGLSIDEELTRANISDPHVDSHAATPRVDDEARARRDQEHYLVSSEILNDSIRQTDAFLDKLRKVSNSNASGAANTSAFGHMSTLPSTGSIVSEGAAGNASMVTLTDDTASIENTAAGIVRQLHEHAQLREGQVRELQECDRIIRRAFEEGGEYLMALAEVEEADEPEAAEAQVEETDPLGIAAAASMLDRRRGERSTRVDEHLHEQDETMLLSASPSDPRFDFDDVQQRGGTAIGEDAAGPSSKATTFQELIKLQQSTTDLIVSLGAIHEHSQIAHASMGDATRRIRNIRTVLTNWQDEVKLMEQSQSWIAAWEAGDSSTNAPVQAARPKDIRQWTQSEMDKFERVLEEAHVKAQQLLKPIQDPTLDRLAASKA